MTDSDDEHDLSNPRWSRAQSPLPQIYANMSPEELERILGINIPRARTWKSILGLETNPPYDPAALRSARRAAYSRASRKANLRKQYEDKMRESVAAAERADAASEAAIHRQREYDLARKKVQDAAKAAKERAKFPLFPITQAQVDAKRREVEDLRGRRVYGHNLSPDYIQRSREHDVAKDQLESLERRFAEQKRKTPGAHLVPPDTFRQGSVFGIPPRPGARSPEGGKSKRVKSKRNKRSTKRRNARK